MTRVDHRDGLSREERHSRPLRANDFKNYKGKTESPFYRLQQRTKRNKKENKHSEKTNNKNKTKKRTTSNKQIQDCNQS